MGVETRQGGWVVCGSDAVVEPVEAEGAHVDGGRSGSEDDDEAEEILGVPLVRLE